MSALIRRGEVFKNDKEIWDSGTIVWSLFSNQWWPSIIITPCNQIVHDHRMYVVFWFGDDMISKVSSNNIIPFIVNYKVIYNFTITRAPWLKALDKTIREFVGDDVKTKVLHKWAFNHLENLPPRNNKVPRWIINVLSRNKVSFENLSNITLEQYMTCTTPVPMVNKRELSLRQLNVLFACKNKEDGLYGYCLACYSPNVEEDHPFFIGHLCIQCLDHFKCIIKTRIGCSKYCCVCADNMNESVICSNNRCMKSYCRKCVKYLFGEATRQHLYINETFLCLLCTNETNKNIVGMLTPRFNFKKKVKDLFHVDDHILVNRPVLKKPLTVISINDFSQIGLRALKEHGIPVGQYYLLNSFNNVPCNNEVRDLGFLNDITADDLNMIGIVDLVIIGSPSMCDSKMQIGGLHEFFRFLDLVKTYNSQQFFWFFEAVASVDINFKMMVDRFLQCKPVKLNISETRLFWGNLPSLSEEKYLDFRTSYGCTADGNENIQQAADKQFLIRNRWDLEFLKKLLGCLSDCYK